MRSKWKSRKPINIRWEHKQKKEQTNKQNNEIEKIGKY